MRYSTHALQIPLFGYFRDLPIKSKSLVDLFPFHGESETNATNALPPKAWFKTGTDSLFPALADRTERITRGRSPGDIWSSPTEA